ncbi:MAG: hypothetical protein EHM56_07625 [Chloroflexi bacterium]|nr:MAG: hypothetical protein EHM56_07625 [Chloroflexota bacterium]
MRTRIVDRQSSPILALALVAAATLLALFLVAVAPAAAPARAETLPPREWVLVANVDGQLSVVDTETDIVYGPFLSGTLGSEGGQLLDVAVTPDGDMALVSNFGDMVVSFVDVSDPMSPSFISSTTIEMFAEDIDVDPHGQFALVTDGGFSYEIDVIDLISRTLAYTVPLPAFAAQAVEIAPDGTVIVVDYFASVVQSLYPDASGQLTVTGVYSFVITPEGTLSPTVALAPDRLPASARLSSETRPLAEREPLELNQAGEPIWPRPVNIGLAPDNQTVIVGGVSPYGTPTETLYALGVYQIISPGSLTFTQAITGLPRAVQSVAFSADGKQAYLNSNGGDAASFDNWNRLMVLDILAPGRVSLNTTDAVDFPRLTTSQLFGVDTIAVANGKAYVSYPTLSGALPDLRVVDLLNYSVKRLTMPGIPTGVDVIPVLRIYLPLVIRDTVLSPSP